MICTLQGHPIEVRKIHHRARDFIGIFFTWNKEIIHLVKRLSDRTYSATHRCWYLPYCKTYHENLLDLFAMDKSDFPFSLLEHNTGTIAAIPAKDDHTAISSLEELLASMSE